jgi:hypothetical protein
MTPFQPEEMLAVLVKHGVAFIVVGGAGAILHGSPQLTVDLDIVPWTDPENLQRLSSALKELQARIRTADVPDGLAFSHDGASLGRAAKWNLQTRCGDLDILSEPGGMGGYEHMIANATPMQARGMTIMVASLEDIIRSKEAAGREKDLAALPGLLRLLAERGRPGTTGEPPRPDRP